MRALLMFALFTVLAIGAICSLDARAAFAAPGKTRPSAAGSTPRATVTWTITATAGTGGTIAPSGAVSIEEGADAPFTIAPDACDSLVDVVVDGVSVGAVTSYTFTNVTTDHTIDATFAPVVHSGHVALSADVNPSTWSQPVTFTATVTPSTATGTITFKDSLTTIGSAPIVGGVATLVKSNMSPGTHTALTAVYAGAGCVTAATSATYSQSVFRLASSVSMTSDVNPSACGSPVMLTATVVPAGGTGRVNFMDDGNLIGIAVVNSLTGVATLNVGNLLPGTHNLTVSYPGDKNVAPSASAPAYAQVVGASPATVVLSSDLNPSIWAQAVTFTATVTPSGATGTVTFKDSLFTIGSAPVVDGVATLVKSNMVTGAHTALTAIYAGDICTSPATSAAYSQLISRAPSTITLSADANPSSCGVPVALTATLSPPSGAGRVTFYDNGNPVGSATINTLTGMATLNLSNLLPGTHPLTVSYPGDKNVAACVTAAPYAQVVGAGPASVVLTSDVNPSIWAQAVTFTATVTPAAGTGTVTFKDSLFAIGSAPVVDGVATLVKANMVTGLHSALTAVYSGDICTAPATSAPYSQMVSRAPSTISLATDVNPSSCGAPVALTATLSPPSGAGRVTFYDNGNPVGSATVNTLTGTATLNLSNLLPGTHPLTVSYPGDKNVAACVTAAPYAQVVGAASATVVLSSDINPSIWAQAVTFTATVTPAGGTGSVTFKDSLFTIGSAPVVDGVATLVKANMVTGVHTALTAVYTGDICTSPAISAPYSQLISRAPSTITLSTDVNPSSCGSAVRLTATLSPPSGTGRVTFYDNGNPVGLASVNTLSGLATLDLSNLLPGAHPLTVSYPGDKNVAACVTASAYSQTIDTTPSTITLSSDVNPSIWGQAVTLMATITPPIAGGTVTFKDSISTIGTATVSGGVAQLVKSNLVTGLHTALTAVYAGDGCVGPATSAPYAQTVTASSSSISLASDVNPAAFSQPVRLTATVTPVGATGRISFFDAGNLIGFAPMNSSTGTATLTVANLTSGSHPLTASFPGDKNVEGSTSSPDYNQVIAGLLSSVSLTTDVNPSVVGQKVTMIATVAPNDATGLVTFYDEATSLGTAAIALDGAAILSVSSLTAGYHRLTAAYGGSIAYAPSTSPVDSQFVADVPAPLVTVTYPNGGENIGVHTDLTLAWTATDPAGIESVSLEVSRDHCATWNTIATDVPNTGAYTWTVPAPGTNADINPEFKAWFRVTAQDSAGYDGTDTSDAPFSLFDAQTAAVITELAAETLDEGISLRWAFTNRSLFTRLELQRSIADAGPWLNVTAAMREEGGSTIAIDRSAEAGQSYFYRLVGTTSAGIQAVFGPVKGTAGAPQTFALSTPWPNPTRGAFSLRFSVATPSHVKLSVLDLQGREVTVLTDGTYRPGRYQADWDGRTGRGAAPAGLYFVRFVTPTQKFVSRVVVAR